MSALGGIDLGGTKIQAVVVDERFEVRGQFSVTFSWIEDVLVPGVSEQNDANVFRRRRLGEDGTFAHANARSTALASWSLGW